MGSKETGKQHSREVSAEVGLIRLSHQGTTLMLPTDLFPNRIQDLTLELTQESIIGVLKKGCRGADRVSHW